MPLATLAQRFARPRCVHAARLHVPPRLTRSRRSYVACQPHRRVSTKSSSSPPSGPLPLPPPSQATHVELTDREMLMRLLRRPQRQWYWLGGVTLVGATLVAFGPELKLGVSKHTAEVATKSLQDETLQRNTRELASQIVQTVLNDAQVVDQASRFIQRLVVMDSTRDALRSLVVHTLNDPVTLAHVAKLAKSLLAQLLDDPKTRAMVVAFLRQTMQDPETRSALLKLLDDVMKDKTMQQNLAQLLAQTFTTDPVKTSVAATIGESVHDVLSRPDIQAHAKQFVGSVVGDQTVQAQSGDAIWGTVMYAITPGWLSWIWEGGGGSEDQQQEQLPVAAIVAVPVVEAEADAIAGETTEAFSDAVAAHVDEEVETAQAPTPEGEPSSGGNDSAVVSPLVAPPRPSRFEMLRRLTMRLPLLSGYSSSSTDDEGREKQDQNTAEQRDHDDAERDYRGGSGGLF